MLLGDFVEAEFFATLRPTVYTWLSRPHGTEAWHLSGETRQKRCTVVGSLSGLSLGWAK
jgi:hypothetical protein